MKNNLYYQDEFVKETFNLKMFGRLLKSALGHKGMFFGSIAVELLTSAVSFVPSLLYAVVLGTIFPDGGVIEQNWMLVVGLCAGGLLLSQLAFQAGLYLENMLPARFGYLFCSELRAEVFNHLTKLSFRYYDTHSTGKILVRVTNYVDEIAQLFGTLFYYVLYCIGAIVAGIIWMLVLDWRIGGALLLGLVPFVIGMFFLSRAIHHRAGRDRNKNSNYTAFAAEDIGGVEVVQAYGRGKLNGEIAEGLFNEYTRAFMKTTRVREAFFPLSHGFSSSILTLVVYGVALAVILTGWGGALTLPTVVAIGSALSTVTDNLGNLCNEISSAFTLTTNLERVYDTLETPVEIHDEEGAVPLNGCRGDVTFDHVNFSYVEGVPVLKDFTLEAKAGQTVAIVGATGSGKTTIVNLLSRFYDIQSGAVLIDGKDVRSFTLDSLRQSVGAMMQDTYIFSGSVLDNIRFARPEATDEECKAAAKAACADGFISRLPEGYDTQISEAYALSGGERQLLSFARLILANPKIIVLDEATSHIDTQTELEVQKSLKTLLAGRTSFVIAHRLSTIRGADKIIFIKDGGIAEEGTHEELLALGGYYAKMIHAAAV